MLFTKQSTRAHAPTDRCDMPPHANKNVLACNVASTCYYLITNLILTHLKTTFVAFYKNMIFQSDRWGHVCGKSNAGLMVVLLRCQSKRADIPEGIFLWLSQA